MTRVPSPYRFLDRIGAGGLGVVYRVQDPTSGQVRALKIMPRSSGVTNLRAEFLSLVRLHHDNIVSVFDYGLTESGQDFFTMEYIEGPPLVEAISEIPSTSFYRLVGGVLRGLSYVHARGMVHADIKPSNILVDRSVLEEDPTRAARLVDFGLAAASDDPAASEARGTFPYAAPEVYAGRLDARSDLYALGVVLYEMCTGAQPYVGEHVASVLAAQRRGPPADPRDHRAHLPAALAELILALLDPAPGARPQTADEVLTRINEVAGTDFTVADTCPLVDLGSTFVGRERDLGDLERMWREARKGRGGVGLVCGEHGIGKSRIVAELVLAARLEGARVFTISAGRSRDVAYSGVADLVRGMLAALGGRSDVVGEWRQIFAPLLGGAGSPSGDRTYRYALSEAVTRLLCELASAQPVLVAVDDVGLGDAATMELLSYLARAVSDAPVLLLLAAQAPSISGENAASPAFQRLDRAVRNAERGTRIDLPPLDRSAVFHMCQGAFGRDIARRLVDDLYHTSGGNPSHASSALEEMVRSRAIDRERGTWVLKQDPPRIPLPADAEARAITRSETLPGSVRAVLRGAAILGAAFAKPTLAATLDVEADALGEALAELTHERLLVADVTAGEFQFAHPAVARAVYDAIDDEERLATHQRAVVVLERERERGGDVAASALARHHLALGHEAGITHAIAAARVCAGGYDYYGALAWFERVRDAVADPTRGAALDEEIADLRVLVGDIDEARAAYERALGTAAHPVDRIRIARRLGELHRRLGEGDQALSVLMKGASEARRHRLTEEEAKCQLGIGWVLMYRGEYKAALEHATAGLLIARTHGNTADAAELERLHAAIEIYRGNTRDALAHLDTAIADAEAVEDATLLAGIQHEVGRAAIHAGDYARAIEALTAAIPVVERIGHIEQAAKSLNNLGAACYFQGDWERARSSWERFRRLCERLDEQSELVNALNNLGSLYRELGQFAHALAVLERAAEVAERTGHAHMASMVLANRGEVLFRQGELGAARDCYVRALSEFERIGAQEDIVETKRRMSELDIASGKLTACLDRTIDAARTAKDAGNRLEQGILHRVAATALRLQGDLESAQWFAEQALDILAELGAQYERAKLDVELSELAAAQGATAEAARTLDSAIEIFASLGARWDLTRARARKRGLPRDSSLKLEGAHGRSGLALLVELSQASAALHIQALLEIALDKILGLTHFERGFILLLDDNGRPSERLRRVREGARDFARDESEFSGTIVRRVAASGEAVSVSDIAKEQELREQRSVVALGLRQIMCAPLRVHGRVIGTIYIDSRRLSFEEHGIELALLEAFAAQVALAIETSRARREARRRTELLSILAHEIRNPLAGILGYSELGQEEETGESGELFGHIRHDAERLKRLVDNVLELARHESGNVDWSMAATDVAALVERTVISHRPSCEQKGIRLGMDTADLRGPALANADRLMQVLANLVGNALKFTPRGGSITISARHESVAANAPEAPPIAATEISAWTPGVQDDLVRDFVRVDVTDTGPGMDAELCSRLFEKFAQGGKRRTKGVGLGLYISREIVQRHGGSIWAKSTLGKGSTFSFRVPVV